MTLSDFLRRPALSKCIPNEFKPLRGIQKMSSSHECMRGEVAPRGSPTTDYPATVRVVHGPSFHDGLFTDTNSQHGLPVGRYST